MSRQWVSHEEWAAVRDLYAQVGSVTLQRDQARDWAMLLETRLAAIEWAHWGEHECQGTEYHAHSDWCPTRQLAHGIADDAPGAAGDGEAQPYRAPSR